MLPPHRPSRRQAATSSPITLDEAIHRAHTADTAYSAAVSDAGVAEAQRAIARSTLLPGIVYHNQFLYTQGTSGVSPNSTSPTTVRFVANNAVHEYISQGVVTETVGGAALATLRSHHRPVARRSRAPGGRPAAAWCSPLSAASTAYLPGTRRSK